MPDLKYRLRVLMDAAVSQTDGGDRDELIKEFNRMLNAGETDDNQALRGALGETDAERYEGACDLFKQVVQSVVRPKRGT